MCTQEFRQFTLIYNLINFIDIYISISLLNKNLLYKRILLLEYEDIVQLVFLPSF